MLKEREEEEEEEELASVSVTTPLLQPQPPAQAAPHPAPPSHLPPAAQVPHHDSPYDATPPPAPAPYPAPDPYLVAPPRQSNISSSNTSAVELQSMASMQPATQPHQSATPPSPPAPKKANDHYYVTVSLIFIATFVCCNWLAALILAPALICAGIVSLLQ